MFIDYRIQSYKGLSFEKESERYKDLTERIKYSILYILDYKTLLPVYKVKTRKALIESIADNFIEFAKHLPDRKIGLPIEFDIINSLKFKKYNDLSRCLGCTLFSYSNSPRGIRVQKRNGMIFPFKINDYYPLFNQLLKSYQNYKKVLPQGLNIEKNEYGHYRIVERKKSLEKDFVIEYNSFPGQHAIIEEFIRESSDGNIDYGFVESIIEYYYVWDIDMLEKSLLED